MLARYHFLVTADTESTMAFLLRRMEAKLREIQLWIVLFGIMLPEIALTNAGKRSFFFQEFD